MRQFSQAPAVIVDDTDRLTDPVWDNAAQTPQLVQFSRRAGSGWADVTCAEFHAEVVALARGLVAAGVQPGDRVALMSRTRFEWTLIDYAIWACGAVTVPVYETSSAEQVQWILADSGAVGCFTETPAHTATVREAAPALSRLWQVDGGDLSTLVTRGEGVDPAEIEVRRKSGSADDPATIVYTSGTTGRPKGCVLTHRNMLSDIGNAIPALDILFQEGSSTVLFLPLAHAFARLLQIGVVQGRVRTSHTADVKNLVDDLGAFRPTFLLSVPRVFEKVYNSARQKAHSGGKGAIFDKAEAVAIAYSQALETPSGPGVGLRIKHTVFDKLVYGKLRAALGGRCHSAISGGAPLGERLGHFFRGVGLNVLEGYGLTETSPAITFNRAGAQKIGTVGQPLPGVTIAIADDGEILARGEVIFPGYWNNPAATAEAIDADGWFHTGDLGSLDDDGFLRITGRKKEIIVTAGGKNVAPAVLEDRVRAHALVSQCMVVGDRQPFIAALVTVDPEALPGWLAARDRPDTPVSELVDDADLRAEIQAAVSEANKAVSAAEGIKVFRILPRDFTEATGELTPSLKVKRAVVMKEYAEEIDAIYHR
ncbi:AMP-dependent synthetase/ligase [Catellatospora citrea]|uniref:Acyl-CoA synthetase n=1 Tax=Catellatospora citrea TaxID=53366 RepID=A0A8J3K9C0_9ACTN|nr:AMP-dependent synthetase/ligase [Catellatospora citrea]RKE07180.1 long-chain acyl-CoA synthetase [Catellatospora citrea]GIF95332.1 long-chain-fatty-acid--CoA ligase [Catellatospora citrea]